MSRPSDTRNSLTSMTFAGLLAAALLLGGCAKDGDGQEGGDKEAATAEAADADAVAGDDAAGGKQGKDGEGKDKDNNAVPVEVARVERRPLSASYSGTASLQAPNEAQVVAKTTGVLLELKAEEGDRVTAGQVLARLDSERSRLEVQRAEAAMRKLEAEYERSEELFARKLIAADAHERIRFDLATQRAAWELARLELSYANVVAPISGVIAERLVKEGNLIQTSQAMFRIVDTSRLEAVLNVPERELATMQPGLDVTMRVDALPGQDFTGSIDRVSPVVDAGSGTFRVTVAFAGDTGLRAGMFGRVGVVYDRRSDVLTVPRSALLQDQGESAVFAVRDNKAVRIPVQLGYVNGEVAEVREGLEEGEVVVTTGKVAVREGSDLQVLNPPDEAAIALGNGYAETVAQP